MAAGGEQTRSAHARDVSLGARIMIMVIITVIAIINIEIILVWFHKISWSVTQ